MNAKVDIGWDGIINIKLKGERELIERFILDSPYNIHTLKEKEDWKES
jgi:hypothetical protein